MVEGDEVLKPPTTPALPKFRLTYSFPHQNIDLDYSGPIYVKNCDHTEKNGEQMFSRLYSYKLNFVIKKI